MIYRWILKLRRFYKVKSLMYLIVGFLVVVVIIIVVYIYIWIVEKCILLINLV